MIANSENSKINWKLLAEEFNELLGGKVQRTIIELYKRYHEFQQSNEIIWTEEEDQRLRNMVSKHGSKSNWFQISMNFDTKNSYNWFLQYKKLIDNNIKKGKWSLREDLQLVISMKVIGDKNWSMISKWIPNRTDVQCRERYWNILDPKINHTNWSSEEDNKLLEAWEKLDFKWSQIAMVMGTRTDNQWWRRYNILKGVKGNSRRRK